MVTFKARPYSEIIKPKQTLMISTIIIEDDINSSQQLLSILPRLSMDIEVKAQLGSVREAVDYFKSNGICDLIISDIQLSDGLSFSIFEKLSNCCPVIFISVHDRFVIKILEYYGIDFISKPVSSQALDQSIKKYKAFSDHFTKAVLPAPPIFNSIPTRKSRIIVKRGLLTMPLFLSDIVLLYTERMIVYAVDNKGCRYFVDKSLNKLEVELDPQCFFRANRQYILNIKYIEGYKMYDRVKLLIQLNIKTIDFTIVVGQEKAREFKNWLSDV